VNQLTPATPSHTELVATARIVLVVSIVVTLALYVVPYGYYVAYPLLLISTVVHEMGHGVAAWIVGGEFRELHMMKDASGYAITATCGDFANAMVLGGGLIGPAVGAAVSFVLARRATTARVCLVLIGAFLAIMEIAVVRNGFGLVFIGILAAVCLGVGLKASAQAAQLVLMVFAVQLALSVFSRSDYLFVQNAGDKPSDVQQMSNVLGLPYWFWGFVCGAISLIVVAAGAWLLIRSQRRAR